VFVQGIDMRVCVGKDAHLYACVCVGVRACVCVCVFVCMCIYPGTLVMPDLLKMAKSPAVFKFTPPAPQPLGANAPMDSIWPMPWPLEKGRPKLAC
jgi:hypothetical protein